MTGAKGLYYMVARYYIMPDIRRGCKPGGYKEQPEPKQVRLCQWATGVGRGAMVEALHIVPFREVECQEIQ